MESHLVSINSGRVKRDSYANKRHYGHSGNSKGFWNSVPRTRDKDQLVSLYYHTQQIFSALTLGRVLCQALGNKLCRLSRKISSHQCPYHIPWLDTFWTAPVHFQCFSLTHQSARQCHIQPMNQGPHICFATLTTHVEPHLRVLRITTFSTCEARENLQKQLHPFRDEETKS